MTLRILSVRNILSDVYFIATVIFIVAIKGAKCLTVACCSASSELQLQFATDFASLWWLKTSMRDIFWQVKKECSQHHGNK